MKILESLKRDVNLIDVLLAIAIVHIIIIWLL